MKYLINLLQEHGVEVVAASSKEIVVECEDSKGNMHTDVIEPTLKSVYIYLGLGY